MDSARINRPGYLELLETREFERRVLALEALLAECAVCPRLCGVNRTNDETGFCLCGNHAIVSSTFAHRGEEPPISGTRGSGTVFFGRCNLRCVYCQNHQISQPEFPDQAGREVETDSFVAMLLALQAQGVHNINFVSPSHFVPQMTRAIYEAAQRGLRIPIVYNSNGYDRIEVLKLLEGIIDIYMPDLKYAVSEKGKTYSKAPDYAERAREALFEMSRQVGSNLQIGPDGAARRGMLIRHLVLPNDVSGAEETLEWIARHLGKNTTVSLMAQYYPAHRARRYPEIARRLTIGEYSHAIQVCERLGMEDVLIQDALLAPDHYRPDFQSEKPFTD